jgi:hypothetical protein
MHSGLMPDPDGDSCLPPLRAGNDGSLCRTSTLASGQNCRADDLDERYSDHVRYARVSAYAWPAQGRKSGAENHVR